MKNGEENVGSKGFVTETIPIICLDSNIFLFTFVLMKENIKEGDELMASNYIRFDWAMKRLLRNKANFAVLEGFLTTLLVGGKINQKADLCDTEGGERVMHNWISRRCDVKPDIAGGCMTRYQPSA